MTRKLAVEWTKHLKDEKGKGEFEALLRNSTITLGRLREILEEKLEALERSETKVEHYNVANWAYMQADVIGSKRTLKNILELLAFTEKRGRK